MAVPDHKNIVVFAFNQPPDYRTIAELNLRVTEAEKIWGLDFNSMLKQLRKDNPKGSGVF